MISNGQLRIRTFIFSPFRFVGQVQISVVGSGFTSAFKVSVGSVDCTSYMYYSQTQMTFTAPSQKKPGTYPIWLWVGTLGRTVTKYEIEFICLCYLSF